VDLARDRTPPRLGNGSIEFRTGDMSDAALGEFNHVVAMDSLIHYKAPDVVRVLSGFAARTKHSIIFTFAPKTPALWLLWIAGRLFPRKDRAPAIEPVSQSEIRRLIEREPQLRGWRIGRTRRVKSGFYKSQALELTRL
jgi:magnesium-protoporphyrin O-methyltransferase